jgi:hypothetical protein
MSEIVNVVEGIEFFTFIMLYPMTSLAFVGMIVIAFIIAVAVAGSHKDNRSSPQGSSPGSSPSAGIEDQSTLNEHTAGLPGTPRTLSSYSSRRYR